VKRNQREQNRKGEYPRFNTEECLEYSPALPGKLGLVIVRGATRRIGISSDPIASAIGRAAMSAMNHRPCSLVQVTRMMLRFVG
jgi:hypothetical protein